MKQKSCIDAMDFIDLTVLPTFTDQIKQMKKWEPSVVIETHFFQHSNHNNSINSQTAAALRETRARAQTARATRADARRAARNKVIVKIMHILHLFWLGVALVQGLVSIQILFKSRLGVLFEKFILLII